MIICAETNVIRYGKRHLIVVDPWDSGGYFKILMWLRDSESSRLWDFEITRSWDSENMWVSRFWDYKILGFRDSENMWLCDFEYGCEAAWKIVIEWLKSLHEKKS